MGGKFLPSSVTNRRAERGAARNRPPWLLIISAFLFFAGIIIGSLHLTGVVDFVALLAPSSARASSANESETSDELADESGDYYSEDGLTDDQITDDELAIEEEERLANEKAAKERRELEKQKIAEIRARWARKKEEKDETKRARLAAEEAAKQKSQALAETRNVAENEAEDDSADAIDDPADIAGEGEDETIETAEDDSSASSSGSSRSGSGIKSDLGRREMARADKNNVNENRLNRDYRSVISNLKRVRADAKYRNGMDRPVSSLELSVKINELAPDGHKWDADGTNPDIMVTIEHPDPDPEANGNDKKSSRVSPDCTETQLSFKLNWQDGAYLVKVWDLDDKKPELIAGAIIYAPPRQNPKIDPSTNVYITPAATITMH